MEEEIEINKHKYIVFLKGRFRWFFTPYEEDAIEFAETNKNGYNTWIQPGWMSTYAQEEDKSYSRDGNIAYFTVAYRERLPSEKLQSL